MMPVSIISNTSARYAQASLLKQSEAVTKGTQRMTSGQRVLSAADDAASMAIGTNLKIENSGLKSAMLNASTGTSMLQIADGALGQLSEILTRLQSLAVQASSGQYDDSTRSLMDGEFQGLKAEVDRLANSTTFNGVNILAGTTDYDVANGSNAAADGVASVRVDPNLVPTGGSFRYSYDAASQNLTLTRVDGAVPVSQTVSLKPLLDGSVGVNNNLQNNQQLEVGFSQLGVTLTLGSNFNRATSITNDTTVNGGGAITVATPTFTAPATNVAVSSVADLTALGSSVFDPVTGKVTLPLVATGAAGPVTLGATPGISYKVNGGTMTASGAASDDLTTIPAGATVEVYGDVAGGGQMLLGKVSTGPVVATAAGTGAVTLDTGGGLITATEDDSAVAATHLTYKVGTGIVTGEDTIGVDVPAMTLKALGMTNLDVSSQADANAAIDTLQAAMDVLNKGRATVGAQQSRLDDVSANLGVISDNNEAARSALMDVDVSQEISDLTTNQTLMQASIAMLSRANQVPDMLLKMLEN